MAAIPTGPTEIDRKLHLVVMQAQPHKYPSYIALGEDVADGNHREFSYTRFDKTEYSSPETIAGYVALAKEIGLLDDALGPTRSKTDIRSLESFQRWLSDQVVRYLGQNNSSVENLESAVRECLSTKPVAQLPTFRNVRARLQNPPDSQVLRRCLKIMSLLRPGVLRVGSRHLVLMPDVVEG